MFIFNLYKWFSELFLEFGFYAYGYFASLFIENLFGKNKDNSIYSSLEDK